MTRKELDNVKVGDVLIEGNPDNIYIMTVKRINRGMPTANSICYSGDGVEVVGDIKLTVAIYLTHVTNKEIILKHKLGVLTYEELLERYI